MIECDFIVEDLGVQSYIILLTWGFLPTTSQR